MKPRLLGMFPVLPTAPYQPQPMTMGSSKRSAVKGKVVGCSKCGAAHVTLRKAKEGFGKDKREFLLCPKCYEKGGYKR